MRSLTGDSYRPSLAGLLIATVLLLAWAGWFLWAPITVFATGQIVSATGDGMVTALFDSKGAAHLQTGQPALIRPQDTNTGVDGVIHAKVANITPRGAQTRVVLYAQLTPTNARIFTNNLTGAVDVEVEHTSPAMLVWRASGQFIDTPAVSLSPQTP